MSKINLSLVNQPNSSEIYPELKTIWPEPYSDHAFHCLDYDWKCGQIFYIKLGNEMIGTTGYWRDPDNNTNFIHLRWTGIIEKYRGKGFGKSALIQLARLLLGSSQAFYSLDPKINSHPILIELIPDNEYGEQIVKPFFTKLGFRKGILRVPGEEDESWPVQSYFTEIYKLADLEE